MNKIIEFFKALIAKIGKTAQSDVIAKTEQKSEEVQTSQTSQNVEVNALKLTKTVKKTADSVKTEKKTAKRRGRPRKVKAE